MFAIQAALKVLGFDPGPVDGIRGPKTDAALVRFKVSENLRARPYPGPITQDRLLMRLAEKKPSVAREVEASDELPWMRAAATVRGLHEVRDHEELQEWLHDDTDWIDTREIAWCGAFVDTCHKIAKPDLDTVDNPLGARNWLKFGSDCEPGFGATLVFWRVSKSSWQGHVGFYHAEDATHFHVLGGNQRNAVTVSRISKSRLLGARVPSYHTTPLKPIMVSPAGVPITTNEA